MSCYIPEMVVTVDYSLYTIDAQVYIYIIPYDGLSCIAKQPTALFSGRSHGVLQNETPIHDHTILLMVQKSQTTT